MSKNKDKKIYLIIIYSLSIFFFVSIFSVNLRTQVTDENEFKVFLNLVIQNSPKAVESGYNFIKKYPNSNFVSDVLYYLSFVETDYFQNIINLKKVIIYYPSSIWRESSLIRLLNIYYLKGNFIQFEQWYKFYFENFNIKNRRWEVELLNLKSLYKQAKYSMLAEEIARHKKNANNYQLLSYCILLNGILLKNTNNIYAKRELLAGLSMFEESIYYDSFIYELYKLSFREEKPYFAKILLNSKIFALAGEDEKKEIKQFSEIKSFYVPEKFILSEYKRDYYYISLGYSSDMQSINEIKSNLEKIGLKLGIKNINNTIYQLYIGFFHFKKEAVDILNKIIKNGYSGEIVFIDYSY